MSTVSNYILSISGMEEDGDDEYPNVAALNERLVNEHGGSVGDGFQLARYGGTKGKAWEASIFMLAANYVGAAEVAHAIREVPWTDPDEVQLFAKHQEALTFVEVEWWVP